jgi:hypothetical protein
MPISEVNVTAAGSDGVGAGTFAEVLFPLVGCDGDTTAAA